MRERCLHKGFSLAELARLHAPVGLALGAQTPEEIAISIASEAVHVRRLGVVPATGVLGMALPLGTPQPTDVDAHVEAPADLEARRRRA